MKKYLLGFDIGTEGSKGLILTLEGKTLAYHYVPHETERLHTGWAEHNADKIWWGDFIKVVRKLLSDSGIDPAEIAGIGCSALSPCTLPLDKNGKPLRNAILYGIDTRATEEIRMFKDAFDISVFETRARMHISSQSVGPKILWLKRHEPEIFEKAAIFTTSTSYLVYKLTGEHTISIDNAGQASPLYNFLTNSWDEELCAFCGITPDRLPRIMNAYDVAGTVTAEAAAETGLAAGTPVVVGSGDFIAELISMCGEEGDSLLVYGSTIALYKITKGPIYKPSLFYLPYPFEGMQFIGGATMTAASLTKWFRDNFSYEELLAERGGGENAYTALGAQAESIPPGSDGLIVLPYFAGERTPLWDSKAKGMMFGLNLMHTKGHVYRALMESVAYSALHHIDELKEVGVTINRFISTGGGVKSHVWTQIMSDVTGVEQLCLPKISGSPAGAAYFAGLGAGVISDNTILKNMLSDVRKVVPNPENTAKYRPYYEIYRKLYKKTVKLMHDLHDISYKE